MMDGGDSRTPMAWQHRDNFMRGDPFDGRSNRYGNGHLTPGGGSTRYGGPPTPSSAHSKASRTPTGDHRRDARGSSSDRYSQHSSRRLTTGARDSRSQTGSRASRSTPHRGYSRSHRSPSSTEETAEETTETDSQTAPAMGPPSLPDPRLEFPAPLYHPAAFGVPYTAAPYPAGAFQPQILGMGPMAPPQLLMAHNGSIRSVQSVPLMAAAAAAAAAMAGAPISQTWDGEPCPVHHQPALPLAALYGLGHPAAVAAGASVSIGPSSIPPSIISGATTVRRARSIAEISNSGVFPALSAPGTPHLDSKSFHGSMMHFNNGHVGRMVVSETGAPSHLPVRDSSKVHAKSPLPPPSTVVGGSTKDLGFGLGGNGGGGTSCCSGHFVVMWIILGIITFGILLGIILKFTVA